MILSNHTLEDIRINWGIGTENIIAPSSGKDVEFREDV